MLLGVPPFNSEVAEITLGKHITDDPQVVSDIDPRITPATSQLINWLLTKNRDKRPKTPLPVPIKINNPSIGKTPARKRK